MELWVAMLAPANPPATNTMATDTKEYRLSPLRLGPRWIQKAISRLQNNKREIFGKKGTGQRAGTRPLPSTLFSAAFSQ